MIRRAARASRDPAFALYRRPMRRARGATEHDREATMMYRAIGAAVLGLALSAAGARADVTLLFWPGPESEAMQKVIDAYNAGQGQTDGVTVDQLLFSRQGYFDKELADLAAGTTEFDLALVTTYTLGRYAPFLEPLDKYLDAGMAERFAPVALDSLGRGRAVRRADRHQPALHLLPQGPDRSAPERCRLAGALRRDRAGASRPGDDAEGPGSGPGTTTSRPRCSSPSRSIRTARPATAPCSSSRT